MHKDDSCNYEAYLAAECGLGTKPGDGRVFDDIETSRSDETGEEMVIEWEVVDAVHIGVEEG